MKKALFVFLFFLVLGFSGAVVCADVPTPRGDGREELIDRELNAAAQRLANKQQAHEIIISSSPDAEIFSVEKSADDLTVESSYGEVSGVQMSHSQQSVKDFNSSPHQFEMGTESYYYKYTESIGVKDTGIKGGLIGAYQFRFAKKDIDNSSDHLADFEEMISFFRLEGRASYGQVEYEGSGREGGIPDWNFETRGLLGSEFVVLNELEINPYFGFGYRYLFNEFSQTPSKIIDGDLYGSGYDRESTYLYIPIGMEIKKGFKENWAVSFKAEYDYFIWGKQVTHLENITVMGFPDPQYDKLSNSQHDGRGWRASACLTYKTEKLDYHMEPFIRYWHIKDSDIEFITSNGSYFCQGNLCAAGMEPDNETYEVGVNFRANF